MSAVVNGLFVAAGVVANLAFERTGLDLYVVSVTAVLAVLLLILHPKQVLLRYYAVAFVPGLVGAVLVKLVHGS